jgi:hypothetical protein
MRWSGVAWHGEKRAGCWDDDGVFILSLSLSISTSPNCVPAHTRQDQCWSIDIVGTSGPSQHLNPSHDRRIYRLGLIWPFVDFPWFAASVPWNECLIGPALFGRVRARPKHKPPCVCGGTCE